MSRRVILRSLFLAAWWGLAVSSGTADEPDDRPLTAGTIRRVVSRVEPAVVSILKIHPYPAEIINPTAVPLDPEDRELLPNDYGTGVLIQAAERGELFVLTAYHVVRGGAIDGQPRNGQQSILQLKFANQRRANGRIFAADPRSDLAIVTFDPEELGGDPGELKPLDWRSPAPARKGDIVVCLGNPYALARDGSASVSWGIISNVARRPNPSLKRDSDQLLASLGTILQLDSRLQLGGSGGPVVDLDGRLLGIGTSLAVIEGYEKSAGFAIPVGGGMRRVIETLLAGQEVEYGLLGVSPAAVGPVKMREYRLLDRQPSAVEVVSVPAGSPAGVNEQIRVQDVLLTINDTPLLSPADLMRVVGEQPPEAEVTVELYRPQRNQPDRGQVLTVRSKLGKWPVRDEEGIVATRPKYPPWRGLRVDYPSARQKYHDDRFLPGVTVVGVAAASAADAAGLQLGQVITRVEGTTVRTPGEFQRAVANLTGNVVVHFLAKPGDPASATIRE